MPGSYGFSCSGATTPASEYSGLTCIVALVNSQATQYCCNDSGVVPGACAPDSTVGSCIGGATGYSCTGTSTPEQGNGALLCSGGVAGKPGSTQFCCVTFAAPTSCTANPNVGGCTSNLLGFSCMGGDTPEIGDPTLSCSVAVGSTAAGQTDYCCKTATAATADSCATSSSVHCAAGASGFSCTGAAVPDSSSRICSEPTRTATGANFCCLTTGASALTCRQDQAIVCQTAGAYGFSCSGTATPATEHSGLTCSAGVVAGQATQYCCQ